MATAQLQIQMRLDPRDAGLGQAAKNGPKELRREFGARLRKISKPLGQQMARAAAQGVPSGLKSRVESATPSISATFTAAGAQVVLEFRRPLVLDKIEKGVIPHPVYAQGPRSDWTWVKQPTEPGNVSRAFEAGSPPIERELLAGMDAVARKLGFR